MRCPALIWGSVSRKWRALPRSEQLASIGTLAAGIAHEINNPLNSILLLAQYALLECGSVEDKDAFQKIKGEAERIDKIVKSILKFATDEKTQKELADLNDIVRHAVDLAGAYIRSTGLELRLDLAPALPAVKVNRTEIEQVLINLIKNAAEATDTPVRVVVTTANNHEGVLLSVSDNGPGIPDEIQPHIFDPFFSTKRGIGGTGLGLSLCHSMIADHQGKLSVDSKMRGGTTFTIELPAAQVGG